MKGFFGKLIILSGLLLSAESIAAPASLPQDMMLKKLRGGNIRTADLNNKPAVIEFWASWCTSCGESMQTLGGWAKKQKGLKFVAVSVDNTIEEARDFFKEPGNASLKPLQLFAAYDDEAKLAAAVKAPSLPATIVVDKDGKVVLMLTGKVDEAKIKKIELALKKLQS